MLDLTSRKLAEDISVQLRNDLKSQNHLGEIIIDFYKKQGDRAINIFSHTKDVEWDWSYTHFLVDRKHVLRYGHGQDRGAWMGGIELGIGPHYFGPAIFWSFANSERFSVQAETEGVIRNLSLLDEFFGYPDALKKVHGFDV